MENNKAKALVQLSMEHDLIEEDDDFSYEDDDSSFYDLADQPYTAIAFLYKVKNYDESMSQPWIASVRYSLEQTESIWFKTYEQAIAFCRNRKISFYVER